MNAPDPRDELLRQAVARTLMARATEAASWLLRRGLGMKVEVVGATAIEPRPERHLYAIQGGPPPPEPPERGVESAIKQLLLDGLVRDAKAQGCEARVVSVDWEEMRQETLREGGCDVELLALVRGRDDEEPKPLIVAVPFADPDESGEDMPWEITGKMAWQMLAWEKLVASQVHDDNHELKMPRFTFVPLYLWPGTGLMDVEEASSVVRHDELPGMLGFLFGGRSEQERARNRHYNLQRLAARKKADRRRRAAAKRRSLLMGDALIDDEELAKLFVDVDVDREFCSLLLNYRAVRLWEQPFERLVRELPPGCVGLALCGYAGTEPSRKAMLERCAWTLRRRLDARSPDLALAAGLLRQVAARWLDPHEIEDALRPFRL